MRKVAIVGCGGSGKSHVARELGRILDAPVTHLDAAFYDDEWNALPMEKFNDVQRELVAQPRWVIDGNYNSTLQVRLEACDTVVLMDVSTVAALYGIFSRQLRHGAGHKGNGVHNRTSKSPVPRCPMPRMSRLELSSSSTVLKISVEPDTYQGWLAPRLGSHRQVRTRSINFHQHFGVSYSGRSAGPESGYDSRSNSAFSGTHLPVQLPKRAP
ncbi:hypothetical protein AB0C61_22145 [Streptomyces sp. NPDC048680]|uniref:hypothetical protein n=1 Tax=Streptomyces sp. NPDC048680 TaxID=3155492 RepID=UPI0034274975